MRSGRMPSFAMRTADRNDSAAAWIDERARAERRSRDECVEALVNAIARGDVVVVRR